MLVGERRKDGGWRNVREREKERGEVRARKGTKVGWIEGRKMLFW